MITVRLAKAREFHDIVQVTTEAFEHESYVSWLHSGNSATPRARLQDLKRYWRKELRKKWYDASHYFLVSEIDGVNVVGAAIWKCPADSEKSPISKIKKALFRHLGQTTNLIDAKLFPSRSLDMTKEDATLRAKPFSAHYFSNRGPHWSLETLGVLPSCRNQGCGKALVGWGTQRAKAENLPIAVICSAGSEGFYKSCGFSEEVGNVTEGEGNPLGEVEGGTILFWNP